MSDHAAPSGWEPPAPGQMWTTPGTAMAGPPTAPPPAAAPPPPVMREGQHLGAMSILTSALLGFAALASVAVAVSFRERAGAVDDLRSMNAAQLANAIPELEDLDAQVAVASAGFVLLYVVTGVAWIVWQRRFVRNASAFAPVAPSLGWGTWGWFVPFAGLYLPQSQLANAARVTDPIRVRSQLSGAAPPILYCWWLAFSGSSLVQVGSALTRPSTIDPLRPAVSFDSFSRADEFAALSYWVSALAAVLGLATVLACTARQRTMLAALDVVV